MTTLNLSVNHNKLGVIIGLLATAIDIVKEDRKSNEPQMTVDENFLLVDVLTKVRLSALHTTTMHVSRTIDLQLDEQQSEWLRIAAGYMMDAYDQDNPDEKAIFEFYEWLSGEITRQRAWSGQVIPEPAYFVENRKDDSIVIEIPTENVDETVAEILTRKSTIKLSGEMKVIQLKPEEMGVTDGVVATELTEAQQERQNLVDSAIFTMLNAVRKEGTPELEWDIEVIGEVRDVIESVLVDSYGGQTHEEFYP